MLALVSPLLCRCCGWWLGRSNRYPSAKAHPRSPRQLGSFALFAAWRRFCGDSPTTCSINVMHRRSSNLDALRRPLFMHYVLYLGQAMADADETPILFLSNSSGRCSTCAMRSRVLLKDRSCPECKTVLDKLVSSLESTYLHATLLTYGAARDHVFLRVFVERKQWETFCVLEEW